MEDLQKRGLIADSYPSPIFQENEANLRWFLLSFGNDIHWLLIVYCNRSFVYFFQSGGCQRAFTLDLIPLLVVYTSGICSSCWIYFARPSLTASRLLSSEERQLWSEIQVEDPQARSFQFFQIKTVLGVLGFSYFQNIVITIVFQTGMYLVYTKLSRISISLWSRSNCRGGTPGKGSWWERKVSSSASTTRSDTARYVIAFTIVNIKVSVFLLSVV